MSTVKQTLAFREVYWLGKSDER